MSRQQVPNQELFRDAARANLLTNGGFELWQRGNGPMTVYGVYTADRWANWYNGTDTVSYSRDTTNMDAGSNACLAATFTLGNGNGGTQLTQLLLAGDGYQLAGKTVAFSMRVRTNVANAVRIGLINNQSGGGTVFSNFHSGNGTYQTLSCLLSMVTTGFTRLDAMVRFAASCTAYIDNAMLVVGNVPADYAPLHPADDLARCLRYYEKIGPPSGSNFPVIQAYAAGGQPFSQTLMFAAKKVVVPTLTLGGTFGYSNASGAFTNHADVNGCVYGATATGLGGCSVYSNVSGYLTAEATP